MAMFFDLVASSLLKRTISGFDISDTQGAVRPSCYYRNDHV